jgi:ubiquinone biosynthesis protein UbiJ
MATQSPFLLLEGFLKTLPLPDLQPPAWAREEVQRRIVLLLNHILSQEKEAMSRLARQKDRVVQLQWRSFSMCLVATPAGLLDQADAAAKADLVLALTEESPLNLAQGLLRGTRPAVRIAGDVQLAAEVNWLADHVRWDLEEDLARVIGDAPAHTLSEAARTMAKALQQFIGTVSTSSPGKAQT